MLVVGGWKRSEFLDLSELLGRSNILSDLLHSFKKSLCETYTQIENDLRWFFDPRSPYDISKIKMHSIETELLSWCVTSFSFLLHLDFIQHEMSLVGQIKNDKMQNVHLLLRSLRMLKRKMEQKGVILGTHTRLSICQNRVNFIYFFSTAHAQVTCTAPNIHRDCILTVIR